jgi:hypothetical protein
LMISAFPCPTFVKYTPLTSLGCPEAGDGAYWPFSFDRYVR